MGLILTFSWDKIMKDNQVVNKTGQTGHSIVNGPYLTQYRSKWSDSKWCVKLTSRVITFMFWACVNSAFIMVKSSQQRAAYDNPNVIRIISSYLGRIIFSYLRRILFSYLVRILIRFYLGFP